MTRETAADEDGPFVFLDAHAYRPMLKRNAKLRYLAIIK